MHEGDRALPEHPRHIPYEHVNENQYSHQWCRINVNGTYWISDAYGLYCGPEPAPYAHPWF